MNVLRVAIAVLLVCGIGLAIESNAWAQKGRSRGGGGKAVRGGGVDGNGFQKRGGNGRAVAIDSVGRPIDSDFQHKGPGSIHSHGGSGFLGDSTERRRQVEQQKLEHRRQVSEHLRGVGEMNGNSQLADVADRLDLKANEHYHRQLAQIDSQQFSDLDDVVGKTPAHSDRPVSLEPNAHSVLEQSTVTSGRKNAQQQRLLVEEQKLNQRMSIADKLRTMSKQQRNPQLDEASRHLEEMALKQYTDQLSKLTDYRAGDGGQ